MSAIWFYFGIPSGLICQFVCPYLEWGSKYRVHLLFKWLKEVQSSNGRGIQIPDRTLSCPVFYVQGIQIPTHIVILYIDIECVN